MASQIRKEISSFSSFFFLLLSLLSVFLLFFLLLLPCLCLSVCLFHVPHSHKAFHSFTAPLLPLSNKPALTLLHVVCLLSGRPWQGLQRGTHLAFLFLSLQKSPDQNLSRTKSPLKSAGCRPSCLFPDSRSLLTVFILWCVSYAFHSRNNKHDRSSLREEGLFILAHGFRGCRKVHCGGDVMAWELRRLNQWHGKPSNAHPNNLIPPVGAYKPVARKTFKCPP